LRKELTMPDLSFFLRGLIIGFSIAAPVGPIGVLCIRRTLAEGRLYGFVSGLGAATADACYGTIAALGLTIISAFLVDQANWLRLIGGAYLCYLGFRTFRAQPADRAAEATARGHGLVGAYTSTLFLTLTNPLTIMSFLAVFAGLGLTQNEGALSALLLVLGVFSGSALWWFLLSGFASLFRSRVSPRGLGWVNRISGIVILAFGVVVLYSLIAPIVNRA
jgi:threonine/homoserine/homoserine lactone efflux protein